jgi:hypothetical protein
VFGQAERSETTASDSVQKLDDDDQPDDQSSTADREIDSIRHQLSVLDAKANLARNWVAVSASVQLKPDDAIQRELDLQVAQIRGALPIRVDSATTLTDVSAGSHSINYRYTVTISAQQMEFQKDSIRQKVTQLARSVSATRMILAKGVALNYSYHAANGTQLLFFSVTK